MDVPFFTCLSAPFILNLGQCCGSGGLIAWGDADVYRVDLANDRIGSFDATLTEDFLYAFSQNAGLDLHVELRYGKSPHHVVEAIFKGLGRAMSEAPSTIDIEGAMSSKGSL